MKRALSEAQARQCENATTPRCQCRCGGRFHGAKRGEVRELPVGDAHRPADQVDERRRRRPGPVERAQLELDEQLKRRALAELEPQLRGLDAMRAAARKAGLLP